MTRTNPDLTRDASEIETGAANCEDRALAGLIADALDRIESWPNWVLDEAATIDVLLPRLVPGCTPVHSISYYGEDTAALFAADSGYLLLGYGPAPFYTVYEDDEGPDAEPYWRQATPEQRRHMLARIVEHAVFVESLDGLLAVVAEEYLYDHPEEGNLIEASLTVLLEVAEEATVAAAGPDAAAAREALRKEMTFVLEAVEDELGVAYPMGPILAFARAGCPAHRYPLLGA